MTNPVVAIEMRGRAALVRIERLVVDSIGPAVRRELLGLADTLQEHDELDRIVLVGPERAFGAGAGAEELGADPLPPDLAGVVAAMERSRVPWNAAIGGKALGAGAALLLGCRYRIAAPTASLGFPEVRLGVVPGGGATQRLPRLIGLAASLELVVTGRPVSGTRALELGLVDAVDADPLGAALALDMAVPAVRERLCACPAPAEDAAAVDEARTRAAARQRGQAAPPVAIERLVASASEPFDAAVASERDALLALHASSQARALRHLFLAERDAGPPAAPGGVEPAAVRRAIVVGGGNMGAGIAWALSGADIAVTVVETDEEACGRARENVRRLVDAARSRGSLDNAAAAQRASLVSVVEGYSRLPPAELAIEAVFEDMALKRAVFADLEKALPSTAVLATNTSYLDPDEIAAGIADPGRVLGLHFFSPAHVMRLLEIVRGAATGARALATGFELARRLDKLPVLAGACDGFIGNRLLARYREAADTVLIDGSTPWEIDEAMVEFGFPMGPYETQDLSGLDIAWANRRRQAPTRDPARRYVGIADRMVEEGRYGRKTSVGWYRYPGGNGPVIDPLIEDLVVEEARFAKVRRREFEPEEIRDRLVTAMINEAYALLDEGIAASAGDIDLVTVHGYGFPRWRGGLMHHAAEIGARTLLERVRSYSAEDPVAWHPARRLERCAAGGSPLAG